MKHWRYWLPAWIASSQLVGYFHEGGSFAFWLGHGIFGFLVGYWLTSRRWPGAADLASVGGAAGVVVMDLLLSM